MKKYIHLINIMVFLLLVVVIFSIAHILFFRDIKNKNENISELTAYLSSEITREDYAISTQRQLQNLEGDISKVKGSIVSNSGDVEFIKNIEGVARKNNLSIEIESIIIENDKSLASSTVTLLKIKASTKGGWSSTYKFLNQLESLPYKIKVNSISLYKTGTTDDSEKTKASTLSVWNSTFEIRVLKYK